MKIAKIIVFSLIGMFLITPFAGCSTPPKGPDTDQIRKRADEGTQDLRMEEQRQKK